MAAGWGGGVDGWMGRRWWWEVGGGAKSVRRGEGCTIINDVIIHFLISHPKVWHATFSNKE